MNHALTHKAVTRYKPRHAELLIAVLVLHLCSINHSQVNIDMNPIASQWKVNPKTLYGSCELFIYQPLFPCAQCWATSRGNLTPLIRSSVIPLQASIQASNGDRHTYHPAQKNPIGQPINRSTISHIIAHRTFMFSSFCDKLLIQVSYKRFSFLVYLLVPYKQFDLDASLNQELKISSF